MIVMLINLLIYILSLQKNTNVTIDGIQLGKAIEFKVGKMFLKALLWVQYSVFLLLLLLMVWAHSVASFQVKF